LQLPDFQFLFRAFSALATFSFSTWAVGPGFHITPVGASCNSTTADYSNILLPLRALGHVKIDQSSPEESVEKNQTLWFSVRSRRFHRVTQRNPFPDRLFGARTFWAGDPRPAKPRLGLNSDRCSL